MTQVFITNTNSDLQASSTPDYWSDLSSAGALGIWVLNGNSGHGAWTQSALYQTTNAGNGAFVKTDDSGVAEDPVAGQGAIAQGIPLVPAFQICQGYGSGNPIASPIISTNNLVDISYQPHNVAVKGVYDLAFNGTTVAIGDELTVKIQLRYTGEPSVYDSYADPSAASIGNLSSLLINGMNKVFSVSAVATAATDQNVMDLLVLAVNAHPVLKTVLTAASENSGTTDDLRLTSKMDGMHISAQLIFKGEKVATSTVQTVPEMGVGNYYQVISDEKKARYASGHFNRMYFPEAFTTFATSGSVYDKVVIRYRNNLSDNVLRGGQAGINTAIIYGVDTGSGGSNDLEEVFPHTPGTATTITFNGGSGYGSPVSA